MHFHSKHLVQAFALASLCISFSVMGQTTATGSGTTGTTGTSGTTSTAQPSDSNKFTMDLAKASLAKQGISNPTQAQLDAERKAIDAQRAQGMGWGAIAHSLGLNFGKVVSDAKRANPDTHKSKGQGQKKDQRSENAKSGDHKGGDKGGGNDRGGDHGGGKGGGKGG